MRTRFILFGTLLLSSCAFPQQVHRIGVNYNNTVASLADELTLVNIIRAKQRLPLHFTSFSRLSGSLTFTGTGGVNAAVHGAGTTITNTTADTTAPTGDSSVVTIARAAATGGSIFTPSVMGAVTTGPSFDIDVLDTQEFYRGFLQSIPFSTVESFLNQGVDNRLIMDLLVERVEYTSPIELPELGIRKGDLIGTFINEPEDESAVTAFDGFFQCFTLTGGPAAATDLAPISRITRDRNKNVPLKMDDLAKLDGKSLALSNSLEADGKTDDMISVQRPSPDSRGPLLVSLERRDADCLVDTRTEETLDGIRGSSRTDAKKLAGIPIKELALLLRREHIVPIPTDRKKVPTFSYGPDERKTANLKVTSGNQPLRDFNALALLTLTKLHEAPNRDIVFRSPEGVIRYLGAYLRRSESLNASATKGSDPTYPKALWTARFNQSLFSVDTTGEPPSSDVKVSARVGENRYLLHSGTNGENMVVLGLVEELVNLQKSSTDRLTTQPVEVLR